MKKNVSTSAINAILAWVKNAYKRSMPVWGLPLIYIGVLLMVIFYLTGLTNHNLLTFLPVVVILFGLITFVKREKSRIV